MITKKKLIQRLNQLRDSLTPEQRESLNKDILDLKLTKEDKDLLTLKNKYEI
jgi:hypothetical protein